MQGVGPGTMLGQRYALQHRLGSPSGAERWNAHDTTLERDVVVLVFPADHPNADAVLDAARRAAGVDNVRLIRVLDVGRSDEVAYVIEESLPDARSMTSLLGQGGLPSEEVRRIVGEVATALEAARQRGLHHLRLTPSEVWRTRDGAIRLGGLATSAALAGVDDVDSTTASRTDTEAIVALAYAGLTSWWPLGSPVEGLEDAPRVVGGVAAPSEIAAGVPGDLDGLCRLTLNDGAGPVTPGDFATQIAPWSSTEVGGLGGSPPPTADDTASGPGLADADGPATRGSNPTLTLPLPPRPPGAVADPRAGDEYPSNGPPTGTLTTPTTGTLTTGTPVTGITATPTTDPGGPDAEHPLRDGDDEDRQRAGAHRVAGPAAGAAAAGAAAGAVAGAVGTVLGDVGHRAGHVAGSAAGKVGAYARTASERAAQRRSERAAAAERAEASRVSLDSALLDGGEEIGPPLPMLPAETAEPPSRNQSRMALGIIAGFLVLVTVAGYWGVSQMGANTNLLPSSNRTVTVTAPPTTVRPGATPSPSATATAPAGAGPIAIAGASGFDPEGDNQERNSEAALAHDGNVATSWQSEGYASPDLGGLKNGVGLAFDLGAAKVPRGIILTLPSAADLTVYVSPGRTLQGATKVASSTGKVGQVSLTASPAGASGRYLIVWFTKVSQVSDGRFRATLAEISLTS